MIDWIDETLVEWGAWSRGDMRLTPGGTVIGRMMKRKQLENKNVDTIDVDALNEDMMLFVDRQIARLPKKFIRFCKLYYKGGHSISDTAERMRVCRATVYAYRDTIHQKLDIALA